MLPKLLSHDGVHRFCPERPPGPEVTDLGTKASGEVRKLSVLKGEGAPERRRLTVMMFTDMVGFSALSQRDEALGLELLEEHRRILRPLFTQHRGVEVKTIGDGFLVEFSSTLDAGTCALEIQRALKARNETAPKERIIQVRIGLHLGDVVERDGDIYGDGVNIASRLEPLAAPGSVRLSEDIYRQLHNKLHAPMTKLGKGELKNIELPVEVYRMDLPGQAPPALALRVQFFLRQRRWMLAAGLLVVALAAVAGVWAMKRPRLGIQGKVKLAVADFINETRDPDLDGLSGMLITSLEQSSRVTVLTRQKMLEAARRLGRPDTQQLDEETARLVSSDLGADALVIATLRRFEKVYSLDILVLDPRTNDRLFSVALEEDSKSEIPELIDAASEETRAALNEKTAEIRASKRVAETTTTNLEAYKHYFRGQQLMNAGKFAEARNELRQAIQLDPAFALAHYQLALTLTWLKLPDALPAIQKALPYMGKLSSKERMLVQGVTAMLEHRSDEALQLFRDVLMTYPREKEALYLAGDILFHREVPGEQHTAEAERYFDEALAVDPDFAPALDHAMLAAMKQGKMEKALEHARHHARATSTPRSYINWMQLLTSIGDIKQAKEVAKQGLQLYPDDPELLLQPGLLTLFHEDVDAGVREFQALAATDKPEVRAASLYGLAASSALRGRIQEALQLMDQRDAALPSPDDVALADGYAVRELWLTVTAISPALAQHMAQQRQERHPGPHVLEELGRVWRGDIQNANERLVAIGGDEASDRIAKALREFLSCARDPSSAIERLQRTTLEPLGMFMTGRCFHLAGRHREAIQAFQRAQVLHPNRYGASVRAILYPQSLYLMGQSYEALGESELAQDAYQRLLDLWATSDAALPARLDATRRLRRLQAAN